MRHLTLFLLIFLTLAVPSIASGQGETTTDKLAAQAFSKDAAKSTHALAVLQTKADQGDADAQEWLGKIKGSSEAPDIAEATKWFRKAAEQGRAYSQFKIGEAYECGCGVKRDYVEAYFWSILAAKQPPPSDGVFLYIDARDRIARRLTPKQKAVADMRVKEWMKTHPAAPEWKPPPRINSSPTTWLH